MNIDKLGDVTIVALESRLDAVVASQLKDRIGQLVDKGARKLIIDLGETQFIDSSGCGALVACLRAVVKAGGDLRLARPTRQAKSLFELTRLHRVFESFEDLNSAIMSFK